VAALSGAAACDSGSKLPHSIAAPAASVDGSFTQHTEPLADRQCQRHQPFAQQQPIPQQHPDAQQHPVPTLAE
jgi:hypothetical protein